MRVVILRLAPPYFLTIAIVAVFAPGGGSYLLLSLVYLANFATMLHIPIGYGVLWSLSVEEHFYFLWPWFVRISSATNLLRLCIWICIVSPLLRIAAVLHGGFDPYPSWFRFDGLAWGALLALLSKGLDCASIRWSRFLQAFAATGLLLFIGALFLWIHVSKDLAAAVFFTAVPLCAISLIGYALGKPKSVLALLRAPLLRFYGDISYWVYLIHMLVVYKAVAFFAKHDLSFVEHGGLLLWVTVSTAVLGASTLTGIAVRSWIELPALRLKSRFR